MPNFSELDSWGFLREKPDSHRGDGRKLGHSSPWGLRLVTAESWGHLWMDKEQLPESGHSGSAVQRMGAKNCQVPALGSERDALSGQERDALKKARPNNY